MSASSLDLRHQGAGAAPVSPPASRALPAMVRAKPDRPLLLAEVDTGLTPLPDATRRHATWSWIFLLCSVLPWSFVQEGRITFIGKRPEQVLVVIFLMLAAWFAFRVNPRIRVTHAWPVVLYSLLAVVAFLPPLGGRAGIGSLFRAGRFFLTLILLIQLLSVFAHDRYIPLRGHIAVMKVVVASSLVSLVAGKGFDNEGRLITQLPALTAPGLAQWTALFSVILVFLLLQQAIPRRSGLLWLVASTACLLLSHSRTPLVAGGAGFVAGVLAMFVSSERARRLVSWTLFSVPVAALMFGPAVQAWFLRGQDPDTLNTLTGRTKAWAKVYSFPRDIYSQLFGVGLTDKSIEGLSIDSGYLSVYHEQGRIGVAIIVAIFVLYLARILTRRPSMPRAIATFLVVYVLIASYTETGIGDMSSYVLHLMLAMVMVLMPMVKRPKAAADAGDETAGTDAGADADGPTAAVAS